ncbi:hypothetical protein OAF54_01580 [bacterium]|nr:hypothetical protein [bacterium]
MNKLEVFPTIFYETNIGVELANDIVHEIKENEDKIKNTSEATQPHPVTDYATDFCNPVSINLFHNYVLPHLRNEFDAMGYDMQFLQSWVSCYTGPHGSHPMHIHARGYNGQLKFSGILFLSNVGHTDFFSVNMMADEYQYSVPSEQGKIVIFPSIVPHQYRAESYDGNHRYTLPFNIDLIAK